MTQFVFVDGHPHAIDTLDEIAAVERILPGDLPVFVGDPHGDHHRNGRILFAPTAAEGSPCATR